MAMTLNDEMVGSTTNEMTLFGAISELSTLSWKLNGLVFGERPTVSDEAKVPEPADKLTQARNRIMDVNQRLREIAARLELLGK